jgi:predicted NBD/HSP70 family sugar kinase
MNGLSGRAAALLAAVHAEPGLTRVDAADRLGLSSGAVTELVARLGADELVGETPARPSGGRGRPTTALGPHPNGPLVLAAAIDHESWRVAAVELGGATVAAVDGEHRNQSGVEVRGIVADAVRRLRRRYGSRVRGLGVSVPGVVRGHELLEATGLGWRDLDLAPIWPRAELLRCDNDATLAALAEARRGAATSARLGLYLLIDAGLGGALVDRGEVVTGAHAIGGEFGHMPFGDPAIACTCGAHGCWGTAVDGTALARLLGARRPREPVSYARRVVARAAAGGSDERQAVGVVAGVLGRGLAGLVNALDPDLVTLGGVAAELLAVAPDDLQAAYTGGLMAFRRAAPAPVGPARLGPTGSLVGAAEQVWAELWSRRPG